jgi:hypothetical protein
MASRPNGSTRVVVVTRSAFFLLLADAMQQGVNVGGLLERVV